MFKHAIAEAMPDDIGRRSGCRQRCWRPKDSALLITHVKGFSGGVGNRIVVPGRQTKLVRILCPGVTAAALRNYCPECRVCDHIYPGHGCCLSRLQGYDVFTTVSSKATESIVKNEFTRSERLRRIAQSGLAQRQHWDGRIGPLVGIQLFS